MRIKLLIILFCVPFLSFSEEEKRLALVIGNSNYDKGELKNPVNDALLIAETLKQLEFDVILDTNLSDKRSFKETIRSFGNRRPNYDVAFVYYAGHGIQVGSENYLLPTKEVFESEYDVQDYGVSVQDIMRYLTGMSDQVNVLILDACRDNPFEVKWNATRSLKGGGLAKIPPPTGSLIAFSTDAGNTAADGDGKNSVYCKSLCKNMLLENTSLDQVFRNVRSDVLKITNRQQRPVESSQLTGQSYFLVKSNYENKFNDVEIILDNFSNPYFSETDYTDKLYQSLEVLNLIISEDPKNIRGLLLLSKVYHNLDQKEKAISLVNEVIEINNNYVPAYQFRSGLWSYDDPRAIKDTEKAIELDPEDLLNIYWALSNLIFDNSKYEEGITVANKALLNHPNDAEIYRQKAIAYSYLAFSFSKDQVLLCDSLYLQLSLEAYSKAIELDPENGFYYMQKGDFLLRDLERYDEALVCFKKANSLKPDEPSPYLRMIHSNFALNKLDEIPELCEQLISLDFNDPEPFYHLSKYFNLTNDYLKSVTYMSIAIFKLIEGGYGVDSELGIQAYLFDLYLQRSKLYNKLNINILECHDLIDALKTVSKYKNLSEGELWSLDIYVNEEYINKKIDEIEKLISDNCNL